MKRKKLLSMILAIIMCLSLFPMGAFAEENYGVKMGIECEC